MDIIALLNSMPGAIAQGLIWGIMAIGVYITYRILDFADLTVDGSFCTGGAVCIVMIKNGYSIAVAMLAAVLAGMLAGLVTGLLHTFMGIPAILSGILTQLGLYSINLKIMGAANIALGTKIHRFISNRSVTGVAFTDNSIFRVAILIAALIALLYWFFGTSRGCAIRATGNNPAMSRAQGINTDANKLIALMISNGIVALAGALLSQFQGFADAQMGRGAIVIGLAAVIIGEAVLGKLLSNFAVRLVGVIFGGIIYFIVYQTVIWLGLDTDMLKLLSAIVVAVFLAAPYWKGKVVRRKVRINKGGSVNA